MSITNPVSQSTLRHFDGAGRLLRSIDPLGRATTYEYDAVNLVTKVIDALGGQTTFTFLRLAGPHPRSLALGGSAPRAGRRRSTGTGAC